MALVLLWETGKPGTGTYYCLQNRWLIVQVIVIASTRPHPQGLVDVIAPDEGPLEGARAVVFGQDPPFGVVVVEDGRAGDGVDRADAVAEGVVVTQTTIVDRINRIYRIQLHIKKTK